MLSAADLELAHQVAAGELPSVGALRALLAVADELSWSSAEVGLAGIWLDDHRACRLHLWSPERAPSSPVVHDHPYGFVSTVLVGELVDTTYVEDASGATFVRHRYTPPHEDARRTDTVRLVAAERQVRAGESYRHEPADLHSSAQAPGTVTLLRMEWADPRELTVALADGAPWVSGVPWRPTADEIVAMVGPALERLDELEGA